MAAKNTVPIVDDTPDNISLLSELLRESYRAKVGTDGQKALTIASSQSPPDLILVDVMMPGMDGYEVCRRLKASDTTRDIPVIFLTAMSQIEDEQKGLEMGAEDYITKPISPPILITHVNTHLRLKNASDLLKNQAEVLEQQLQERTQQLSVLNASLARFVPDEFLRVLQKKNINEVNFGDHISKEVAVLLSDVRSFTTLSETMTPEQNFDFVNRYFSNVSPGVREHEGMMVKYLGDSMMASKDRSRTCAESRLSVEHRPSTSNVAWMREETTPGRRPPSTDSASIISLIVMVSRRAENSAESSMSRPETSRIKPRNLVSWRRRNKPYRKRTRTSSSRSIWIEATTTS